MNEPLLKENLLIDGNFVEARSGKRRELINPADGKVWASIAEGDAEDIDAAVQAAQRAYDQSWKSMNSRDRTQLMLRLAQLIRENVEELAVLESRNVGKPIRDSRDEVGLAANCFEYYAGAINKIGGQTIPGAAPGLNFTLRQPLGVCGLIVPWNFPVAITAWKTAPALAMGNTVVLKPAQHTPLTALRLGKLALEAGFPPGVLNVVAGDGPTAGEALVRHPQVRKIAFTGSTKIGKHVMQLSAQDVKRVTLELGGKSANIIFADADLEAAVPGAVWSVLGNAGQDCCARSRLLIEKPVYEKVVEGIAAAFEKVKVNNPLEDATEMGPLYATAHLQRVQEYIESGKSDGAALVSGGNPPAGAVYKDGDYLQPTLFADARPDMRIMAEEIFGPVLCAMPFSTEAEALKIANDSIYGLSGSVWTRDGGKALRVATALETGVLSINSGSSVHLEAPFGGMKQSGLGRDLGLAALDHYSEIKSIYFHID